MTKPDVKMKVRCVVQIACNDKVFDASENVFSSKLLVEGKEKRLVSLIKQVVGRVCRRCPMLYSSQPYVLFEVVLQTLPVILELLSALVYESW